jgi:hypothetical protein
LSRGTLVGYPLSWYSSLPWPTAHRALYMDSAEKKQCIGVPNKFCSYPKEL